MLAKVFLHFMKLLNILMPGKYSCARLTFSDRILLSNFTKILTKIQYRGLVFSITLSPPLLKGLVQIPYKSTYMVFALSPSIIVHSAAFAYHAFPCD